MENQSRRGTTLLCEFMSPKSHSGTSKDLNSSHTESVTIISYWPPVRTSQAQGLVRPPSSTPPPPHIYGVLAHSLLFVNATQPSKVKPNNQAKQLRMVRVTTPPFTPSKPLPLPFLLPRLYILWVTCFIQGSKRYFSLLRPSITILWKTAPHTPLGLGVWRHGRAFVQYMQDPGFAPQHQGQIERQNLLNFP